jgi:hypothetical protein
VVCANTKRKDGDERESQERPCAHEAHMRDADGNRVTVYVTADFEVVSVESGH